MPKKNKKDFDEVLLESIDETLTAIGEAIKSSLYLHLAKEFSIKKHEIPQRTDDFSDALECIFGLGASHLEILIMKSLYTKVNCQYSWEGPKWLIPDLTFKKYLALMKLSYENPRQTEELEGNGG